MAFSLSEVLPDPFSFASLVRFSEQFVPAEGRLPSHALIFFQELLIINGLLVASLLLLL